MYFTHNQDFAVIVIGGGHAGCEAALASARLNLATLLLTISLDSIAQMPCNPSIGGPAKGHLVREIDALGGEMAKVIDKTAINIRMLNTSKGPAVQALRAQAEKKLYQLKMKQILEEQNNLLIFQDLVEEIVVKKNTVQGVLTQSEIFFKAKAVIICSGTFLQGKIHTGNINFSGGRLGEISADNLSLSLKKIGLELGRLKTGTPPRVNKNSINFKKCEPQFSDNKPYTFSYSSPKEILKKQLPCYLTYTNEKTHKIILKNIHLSAMYSGNITGIGPRYCPSIEDKVKKFPSRNRHPVFLEPEGFLTNEYYIQGLSTSLPLKIQYEYLQSVSGLEDAQIMRPGYAVEYDFVYPTQLHPTLETKKISGLFLAGQINGTSGYEEAAAQGLIAGINTVQKIKNKKQIILKRNEAYMGVLIDDLITKGTLEPYRMFTARCEHRLLLRFDNADERLMPLAYKLKLINKQMWENYQAKKLKIKITTEKLKKYFIYPNNDVQQKLKNLGSTPIKKQQNLLEILRRPEMSYDKLQKIFSLDSLGEEIKTIIEINTKYEGYIKRETEQISQLKNLQENIIPENFNYNEIKTLSREAKEKLNNVKPENLAQASRIPGITPADITVLLIYLKSFKKRK